MPIDFTPPEDVARYATEGLRLREQWGRGGTEVGIGMAKTLATRTPLSAKTILRMYSFFARHEVDKRGKNFGNPERPSNGYIAWMLWGGDPAKAWVTEVRALIRRSEASCV